jgi:hypothetical protein
MALPKIEYPIFDVHLKSLNRKVKFRPFLVKEEKLLLMAKEASDLPTVFDTVKQIVNNCCLEELDVANLPIFDIEMIFVHLRLKSVGENLELIYKCNNVVEDKPCDANMAFEVDLNEVQFVEPKGHTNKIMVTDKVGVCLKYPSLSTSTSIAINETNLEDIMELIVEHLDYIFDENSKYDADSITRQELEEFVGSLSLDQIGAFKEFFNTLPYIESKKEVTCNKCGYQHTIRVQGIDDFFG